MSAARLEAVLAASRGAGRLALIPYLTAGDPDGATTVDLLLAVQEQADVIEIGVPYSDPLADGPVIQRASERALRGGMTLKGTLERVREARDRGLRLPVVLFTYFNPVLRRGLEPFAREAASSGVDGVLVTDLPLEESGPLREALDGVDLAWVPMLGPQGDAARLDALCAVGRGLLYYVSRVGVTGARTELPAGLLSEAARVRRLASLPVAVGFGLSRPEHLAALTGSADAAVVGSVLVKALEEALPADRGRVAARLLAWLRGGPGTPDMAENAAVTE